MGVIVIIHIVANWLLWHDLPAVAARSAMVAAINELEALIMNESVSLFLFNVFDRKPTVVDYLNSPELQILCH